MGIWMNKSDMEKKAHRLKQPNSSWSVYLHLTSAPLIICFMTGR